MTPKRRAGLALLALLVACSRARAQPSPATPESSTDGQSWRIESDFGRIYAWKPAHYDATTAGIVVYVPGYGASIDEVWQEHGLAQQFGASGRNALFIVPESPRSSTDAVRFTSLTGLLAAVRDGGIETPAGPIIVAGHSGAFRTILCWLSDRRLRGLILLDGLYGLDAPFRTWIRPDKGQPAKKIVLVGSITARKSERFARRYATSARRSSIPDELSAFTRRELKAPILYLRSQYEHMDIVLSGRVLPLLLRLTNLKATIG